MTICKQITISEPIVELTAFNIVETDYIPEADNVKMTYTTTGKCTITHTKGGVFWYDLEIPSAGDWSASSKLSPGTHEICASVK